MHVIRRSKRWLGSLTLTGILACSGEHDANDPVAVERAAIVQTSNSARQAPGTLRPQDTEGSSATDRVAAVGLNAKRFVTVHRRTDLANAVRLVVWELDDTGALSQPANGSAFDDTPAGEHIGITAASVARVNDNKFVLAARLLNGDLRITSWSVSNGGALTRDATIATGGGVDTVAVGTVSQVTSHEWSGVDVNGDDTISGPSEVGHTPDEWQVVVAVGVSSQGGQLKLIPCRVDAQGVTRVSGDASVNANVSSVSVAALARPFGTVVTASKDASTGKLRVHAWTVGEIDGGANPNVTITPGLAADASTDPDVLANAIDGVSATRLSYRRVAIATQKVGSTVSTWNLVGSGATLKPVLHRALTWGTAADGPISIVNGGGSRLYTVSRSVMRSWEAIDQLVPLEFQSLSNTGTSSSMAVAHVHPDRPVAVLSDSDQVLSVRSFRDLDVPLLRHLWPSQGQLAITGAPTGFNDVPSAYPVTVDGLTHLQDVQIAVGRKAVLVSDGGRVIFYNRAGQQLTPRYNYKDGSGPVPTSVSWGEMFRGVVNYSLSSDPNPQSLKTHLTSQEACDPALPETIRNRCDWGAVDPRVIYDDTTQRFFLLAQQKLSTRFNSDRYQAIAVSRSDDPRDGFFVYALTEEKSADMTRISATDSMVLIGKGRDDPLSPALVALHKQTLMAPGGAGAEVRVPVSKVAVSDVGDSWVRPAVQYGNSPLAIVYRYTDARDVFRLLALGTPFGPNAAGTDRPTVAPVPVVGQEAISLSSSLGDGFEPDATVHIRPLAAALRQGSFIFTAQKARAGDPNEYRDARTLRITFTLDAIQPVGQQLAIVGHAVATLPCPEQKDCKMVAATERQNRVLVNFMRRSDEATFFPSAEYAVFDASTMSVPPLLSGVAQQGLAKTVVSDVRAIDSAGVAPDPVDGSLWLIQDYGKTATAYGAVVGRVTP